MHKYTSKTINLNIRSLHFSFLKQIPKDDIAVRRKFAKTAIIN